MGIQSKGVAAKLILPGIFCIAALTLVSLPAAATCSVCTTDGECQAVETSGNCSCNIRFTDRGFQICRPVGVCDLLNPTGCDGGAPPNGRAVRVDPAGLRRLESQDPLLGAALLGAAEPTFRQDGTSTGTFLRFGIHEGTLKAASEEVGYRFRVVVSEGEGGRLKLRGTLTSATGGVVEFRGDLVDGGLSGRVAIERDSRGTLPRVLSWDAGKEGADLKQ